MSVRITGLTKSFGAVAAVQHIDLEVETGAFFTLLGPSGCGKTTLLRCIAGIYAPDAGTIALDGADVTRTPMHARNMAMVFQNHALFPHMTAADNVAFGLRMQGMRKSDRIARVDEVLDLVQLTGLGNRKPTQLSGGQQQRVALARALAVRPRLLLLDEPLSNLDARLRDELRIEIRALQHRLGVTTLLVTHDIQEAFVLSDRVAVLRGGRIEQIGLPRDLYRTPTTRFVASFVGSVNEIPLVRILPGPIGILHDGTELALPAEALGMLGEGPAWLLLRPEVIILDNGFGQNPLSGIMLDMVYAGAVTLCRVGVGDAQIMVQLPGDVSHLRPGMSVGLRWNPADSVVRRDQ